MSEVISGYTAANPAIQCKCGGIPRVWIDIHRERTEEKFTVACARCGKRSLSFATEGAARRDWNKRVQA